MDDKILRACMAELVGTFAFVLVSAAAVCVCYLGALPPEPATVAIVSGLATGLIYAAALAATVPIGGGYLNPGVTIVLWVFRRLDGGKAIGLVFAQVLGSVVAGAALYFLVAIRDDVAVASDLGTPRIASALQTGSSFGTILKGIGLELILSGIVVFVLFATVLDPRVSRWGNNWLGRLSFLWIGLALGAATIVGSPLTGAGLNPARWLGPALWDLRQGASFQYHAVYWVGPIAGALIAGWIYTALVLPPEEDERLVPASRPGMASSAAVGSGLARSKK
jgi:aquaporin Z